MTRPINNNLNDETSIPLLPLVLVVLTGLLLCAATAFGNDGSPRYRIEVNGPIATLDLTCDDPCRLEEKELVGTSGGGISRSKLNEGVITGTRNKEKDDMDLASEGITCIGNCTSEKSSTQLAFEPKRKLYEGIRITIDDGNAHFVFYSVVDTETGRATRSQYSDFRIDRPLIQLELHEHSVEIRMMMEDSGKTTIPADRNP